MKVHLRADLANGTHTRFTIFINGANCGQLCMTENEALFFHDALLNSNWLLKRDEVTSSGRWMKDPEGRKPQ